MYHEQAAKSNRENPMFSRRNRTLCQWADKAAKGRPRLPGSLRYRGQRQPVGARSSGRLSREIASGTRLPLVNAMTLHVFVVRTSAGPPAGRGEVSGRGDVSSPSYRAERRSQACMRRPEAGGAGLRRAPEDLAVPIAGSQPRPRVGRHADAGTSLAVPVVEG